MKTFNKIFIIVLVLIAAIYIGVNTVILHKGTSDSGRPYQVEINRIALEIENHGYESVNLGEYSYVTDVERYVDDDFYTSDSDYSIREINGELYRFDYSYTQKNEISHTVVGVNIALGVMTVLLISVLLFVRRKILVPFVQLTEVPYELSKGNLTVPLKENSGRLFGRFVWGVDLLREKMEEQKQRELDVQKERKVLLLSLSHDLKTPLSAIKLYAKALSKGLYAEKEKQQEIAENINAKADEIEGYVAQIISASREDFLEFDVSIGEFYLSELVNKIKEYYTEKLALIKTEFMVSRYLDCLITGDIDRSIEVIQNIMENAIKYGDGKSILIDFSEEDGCILISVKNSGCTLAVGETAHIFESFWRGSNSENTKGSGLGLYICRQLMYKMNGDIFADIRDGVMKVTVVFSKL